MTLWQTVRLALTAAAAAGLVAWSAQDAATPRFEVRSAFVASQDEAEYAPDRVLVQWHVAPEPQQIDAVLAPLGARFLERGVGDAFDVLQVPAGRVMQWVGWLSGQDNVVYAEPDYVAWMASTPNDTYFFPYQWNFYDYGVLSNGVASNYGVQGQSAWNTTTGSGVTVAIVDTGIAYENFGAFAQAPDLAGATFVTPWDFVSNDSHANDDNGHGTHVAGTVRQSTNNSMGCAGLAYNCKLMPVKVLNSAGSGYHSAIANGIRHAADNGAFVINLSLGSSTGSSTLSSAVDHAHDVRGCVIAAATGNNGRKKLSYPAAYSKCIAVGATRFDGNRAVYSQYGSGIDLVAPGGDVYVDQNGDGYGDGILQQTLAGSYTSFGYYFFEGTSMATPHVAAAAALVKANKSTYTNAQVRNALQNTAKDRGSSGYDTTYGYGIVNAKDAINY